MQRIATAASIVFLVTSAAEAAPPFVNAEEKPARAAQDPDSPFTPVDPDDVSEPRFEGEHGEAAGLHIVEQGSPEAAEVTADRGRGIEYGGHLVMPIWISTDQYRVGLGLQGRVGWEFPKGFSIELHGGVQGNAMAGSRFGGDSLLGFWIGGGARYAFLNPTAFVPFVGLHLQVNFWSECIERYRGEGCEAEFSQITGGIGATIGAAYEINPKAAIEFGLQLNGTAFENAFGEKEGHAYLSPFVGFMLYY